ncbi:toxic anion resistance protein [Bacillus sp. CGMCC 1.16541]|uniref:toxic anion resistance protein n=1 Tax=Bacillus sp. CGMCC 1.16541 TaxID=2185143 RepID=UPI000D72668B|nr:toxic anion resistance protein [Bacillus sp. CGMCC 1.16541]
MTDQTVLSTLQKEEGLTEQHANDVRLQLRQDPSVQQLSQQVDYRNQMELLEFGKEPAIQISQFSDRILSMMRTSEMNDSSKMLQQLGKLMDKFDKNDFEEKKGFLGKLFKRGEKLIEKIFEKYQTLGKEIEKIHQEISGYKDKMVHTSGMLEDMYQHNIQYYMELERYIVAGQLKVDELKGQAAQLEQRAASGDQMAAMNLDTLQNGIQTLEERIYDLEMARMVAVQTAPQIRLLQRGNTKLIGKINSAFITTIPIFKNGIIQAVAAKRQKLVADSLSELDRRTNEMILRNAQNISSQSVEIAKLAGSPSVKVETLEESWSIIMKGMEETKAIEDENKRLREDGTQRILQLQEQMKSV